MPIKRGSRKPDSPRPAPGSLAAFSFEYQAWLGTHGYSERTAANAKKALKRLDRFLQERGIQAIHEVTRPVLEAYQRWLFEHRTKQDKPLSFSTQNAYLMPVRSFFKWMTREHHILYNPASELTMPKVPRKLPPQILSRQEVAAILDQPDLGTEMGIRDRAILELLYATGIRRNEVIHLGLTDLDQNRCTLFIREGKGKQDRMVPVGERALLWADKYLRDVRPKLLVDPNEAAFFLTSNGLRMIPKSLGDRVHRYVKAGCPGKSGSCHLFRHAMATHMLENGADIRFIQAMLGHAQLTSTQIYTHVAIGKLMAVYGNTHPAARLEPAKEEEPRRLKQDLFSSLAAELIAQDKHQD